MDAFIPIWSAMAASNLARLGRVIGRELGQDDVEPLTWLLADHGRKVDAVAYTDALFAMQTFSRRFMQWWSSDAPDGAGTCCSRRRSASRRRSSAC